MCYGYFIYDLKWPNYQNVYLHNEAYFGIFRDLWEKSRTKLKRSGYHTFHVGENTRISEWLWWSNPMEKK